MADHRLHGPLAPLSQPSPEVAADPVPRQMGWQDLCPEKPAGECLADGRHDDEQPDLGERIAGAEDRRPRLRAGLTRNRD